MQHALSRARAKDARAVLATLVWRQGSTYRRAGARALIVGDEVTGLLSGGCLEADIAEHAKMMLAKGQTSVLISYDLASDEADSLLGIGHGCKGSLGIVLEVLSQTGGPDDPMALLAAHQEGDEAGAVAHLPRASHENGVRRLWRFGSGSSMREHTQGQLAAAERALLSASLDRAVRERKTITDPKDANGVVAEYLPRPLSLLIVGAGVDALPVVDFALGLGFRITMMDHRSAALSHPRLATTTRERVLVNDLAVATSKARARAALVMTHNLRSDEAALTGLLAKDATPREYIGVLGPRARTEKMLTSIGTSLSARPEMSAPAGLDLGGDGADAVALAIVSEIFARLHGRDGRSLSMKEGPIHEP